MRITLPPLVDDFEAACYRAVLGLIIPPLRGVISDCTFNWPSTTSRSESDWTTCVLTFKKKHLLAVIFGQDQKMITFVPKLQSTNKYMATSRDGIPLETFCSIADPKVHIMVGQSIKPLILLARQRAQK